MIVVMSLIAVLTGAQAGDPVVKAERPADAPITLAECAERHSPPMALTVPIPGNLGLTNRFRTKDSRCHLVDGVNIEEVVLTVTDGGKRKVYASMDVTFAAERGHDKEVRSRWEFLVDGEPVHSFDWLRDGVEEEKRYEKRAKVHFGRAAWDRLLQGPAELRITLWVKND